MYEFALATPPTTKKQPRVIMTLSASVCWWLRYSFWGSGSTSFAFLASLIRVIMLDRLPFDAPFARSEGATKANSFLTEFTQSFGFMVTVVPGFFVTPITVSMFSYHSQFLRENRGVNQDAVFGPDKSLALVTGSLIREAVWLFELPITV